MANTIFKACIDAGAKKMLRAVLNDDIKRLEIEREKAVNKKMEKETGGTWADQETAHDSYIEQDSRTVSIKYLYELVDEIDNLDVCKDVYIIGGK